MSIRPFTVWLLSSGLLAALAAAQTPATDPPPDQQIKPDRAASEASSSYWLRVTGDRVNLRARPDTNSLIIAKLMENDVLTAAEELYGWQRVRPPEGTFSLVHGDYIELSEDGKRGVVNLSSGNLRVRTGSLVQDRDPLQSEVQVLLPNRTAVRVLGRDGDWLRIAPPKGVWMYISADYVEQIPEPEARALLKKNAARDESLAERGADLSGEWGRKLQGIEQGIEQERQAEFLKQDWPPLIEKLRPIAAQDDDEAVARLATHWIAQLEQRIVDQEALRTARRLVKEAPAAPAKPEAEPPPDPYVARGQLLESVVLGERDGTRFFKLRDPLSRKVIAYLEIPAGSKLSPEPLIGRYVGVKGASRHEPRLGTDLIRVADLVYLGAARRTSD